MVCLVPSTSEQVFIKATLDLRLSKKERENSVRPLRK